MATRILLAICLASVLAALTSGARAADFADMVRDLNSMQNRMVMGDPQAKAAVARQFDLVEQVLATVDPEIWADEKYVRAGAIYLLAGGEPSRLREFFEAGFIPQDLAPLLEASLNYAEGQSAHATKLLLDIDARRYSPVLGGHIALVQGGSIAAVDKARAVSFFDLARLLMPASLVEEAALRRELSVIDPARESDKLSLLATRYASKYSASPYAQNFWSVLRGIVLHESGHGDHAYLKKFEAALERAEPAQRLDIYLTLTRRDLLDGEISAAAEKLSKAERSADTPLARRRAAAYRAAVNALVEDNAANAAALRDIDQTGLPREDLNAVSVVVSVLSRLNAPNDTDKPSSSPDGGKPAHAEEPEILAAARDVLSRSEEVMRWRPKQ